MLLYSCGGHSAFVKVKEVFLNDTNMLKVKVITPSGTETNFDNTLNVIPQMAFAVGKENNQSYTF